MGEEDSRNHEPQLPNQASSRYPWDCVHRPRLVCPVVVSKAHRFHSALRVGTRGFGCISATGIPFSPNRSSRPSSRSLFTNMTCLFESFCYSAWSWGTHWAGASTERFASSAIYTCGEDGVHGVRQETPNSLRLQITRHTKGSWRCQQYTNVRVANTVKITTHL